jgi:D-tyrosyl-tRNA(Tyr) deacylase
LRKSKVFTPFSGDFNAPMYLCFMRAVIQRVSRAQVTIDQRIVGAIEHGCLILLGIAHEDTQEDIDWLVQKLSTLRIFADETGKMNLDIQAVHGSFLVVSQFTLHARYEKGNRPSYIGAAPPDYAIPLYKTFVSSLRTVSGCSVATGEFGAMMAVELVNDGPVTILIDTHNKE